MDDGPSARGGCVLPGFLRERQSPRDHQARQRADGKPAAGKAIPLMVYGERARRMKLPRRQLCVFLGRGRFFVFRTAGQPRRLAWPKAYRNRRAGCASHRRGLPRAATKRPPIVWRDHGGPRRWLGSVGAGGPVRRGGGERKTKKPLPGRAATNIGTEGKQVVPGARRTAYTLLLVRTPTRPINADTSTTKINFVFSP